MRRRKLPHCNIPALAEADKRPSIDLSQSNMFVLFFNNAEISPYFFNIVHPSYRTRCAVVGTCSKYLPININNCVRNSFSVFVSDSFVVFVSSFSTVLLVLLVLLVPSVALVALVAYFLVRSERSTEKSGSVL